MIKLVITKELEELQFQLEHFTKKLGQFCFASEVEFYDKKIREIQDQIEEIVFKQLYPAEVVNG